MNNEITLRTSKGEYLPGETVFGAVYLHVRRPTEATGIRVSFKGLETCTYEYKCDGSKETLKNVTTHVDFSDVNLYSQADFIQFGSYVFPFQFHLPKEIPGTFQCSGQTLTTSWNVNVTYTLYTQAVGAEGIEATQSVVVWQTNEEDLRDRTLGTARDVSFEVSRFPLGSRKIHITTKLIENFKETGSNMQIRLVITNPTKVTVTGLRVLLLRYLNLTVRDSRPDKRVLDNMEEHDDLFQIAPEAGPFIVHQVPEAALRVLTGVSGLDRLQIPLKETSGQAGQVNIPPSVRGKHVKNQYQIEISISFNNGHKQSINLPVPGILPGKNQQWLKWKPPEWTFTAETKLSASQFSATEQLLHTEAFSGLPAFQVL